MQDASHSRRAALTGFGAASAALLGVAAGAPAAYASTPAAAAAHRGDGRGADVRAFGARGDGTADDTHAFTRAFAAAKADGSNLVVVPAGSYRITQQLTVAAPIHLVGLAGEAGSVLKFDAAATNGLSVTPASSTGIYPGPAIEIEGLWFDYAGPGAALLIDETGVKSVFHDTRVTGCRFHLGGTATGFSSVNQRSIIVAHNQFLGHGTSDGTGVALSDSDNTMITDNVFYDLQYCIHGVRGPVRVFNAGCTVLGNSMSGSQKSLFFENWETVQATGNMLDGASVNAVHFVDCYNSVLSNNYLGPTGTGPALLFETAQPRGNQGQISFTTNYINYYQGVNGTAAVVFRGAAAATPIDQITFAHNIVNNAPAVGIELEYAQNVLITGNTLSHAGSGAVTSVLDHTPGANHIINNIVDGAVIATGDTVKDNFTRVPLP
jgi:hypothetical protein